MYSFVQVHVCREWHVDIRHKSDSGVETKAERSRPMTFLAWSVPPDDHWMNGQQVDGHRKSGIFCVFRGSFTYHPQVEHNQNYTL